jgi:hypothetical protein
MPGVNRQKISKLELWSKQMSGQSVATAALYCLQESIYGNYMIKKR